MGAPAEGNMMFAEFFPVVVTALPADEDHAPLLVDPAAARIVRADQVQTRDTVLAAFGDAQGRMPVADYFNDQYNAYPYPFAPECDCGVCETMTDTPGPIVNLGRDNFWDTCDPWPAAALVLIVPAL
ncbi:hypothetical protein ACFC63_07920 [Streptomyces albidoflavus]